MPLSTAPTKGVFTRYAVDWNIAYAANVFVSNLAGANFNQASLYNNATDGTVLGIYGWTINVSTSTAVDVSFSYQLGPQGTFGHIGGNIDPLGSSPWGLGYFNAVAADPPVTAWVYMTVRGQQQSTQFMRAPRFVLLPGWSLCATCHTAGASIYASFWYVQINLP